MRRQISSLPRMTTVYKREWTHDPSRVRTFCPIFQSCDFPYDSHGIRNLNVVRFDIKIIFVYTFKRDHICLTQESEIHGAHITVICADIRLAVCLNRIRIGCIPLLCDGSCCISAGSMSTRNCSFYAQMITISDQLYFFWFPYKLNFVKVFRITKTI